MARWRCRDDDRVYMGQGVLDAGIYGNALVDLWSLVTGPGEPLVYPDNRRHPCRGPEDSHMPGTPVADPYHCHTDSPRFPRHHVPPCDQSISHDFPRPVVIT